MQRGIGPRWIAAERPALDDASARPDIDKQQSRKDSRHRTDTEASCRADTIAIAGEHRLAASDYGSGAR
jgi:hypothetical protein